MDWLEDLLAAPEDCKEVDWLVGLPVLVETLVDLPVLVETLVVVEFHSREDHLEKEPEDRMVLESRVATSCLVRE